MDKVTQLLEMYEPLVYRVLSDLSLSPQHADFDDMAQELRIRLLDLANRFEGNPLEDRYTFTHYAHRGLAWYALDVLKRWRQSKDKPSDKVAELTARHEENKALNEWAMEFQRRLNPDEQALVEYLMLELSNKEIASMMHVDVSTVYRMRRKIRLKLRDMLELSI